MAPDLQENHDDTRTDFIEDTPVGHLITQGPSVVDLLRNDLQKIAEAEDVLIPVAGYESSGLKVKYRLPEGGKEVEQIARRVERETKDRYLRGLYSAMDTMIALCIGLYVQPIGVDKPVELDPNETGRPVRFDPELASILGLTNGPEPINARAVVRKLFDDKELIILNHSEKLSRWLADTGADLEASFFSGE